VVANPQESQGATLVDSEQLPVSEEYLAEVLLPEGKSLESAWDEAR